MLYVLALVALAVLAYLFRVQLAGILKRGVDELEDIVGDFTSLDDRLGDFISRKEQEAEEKAKESEEAADAALSANQAADWATRVQSRVREIVK